MHSNKLSSEQINQIRTNYSSGQSSRKIAKQFGVTSQTILYHLKLGGIKIRSIEDSIPRNYTVDRNFFHTIDTEEKAYWLGFLYADGCICDQHSPYLSLTLSRKDEEHIVAFQKSIGSNHRIYHSECDPRILNGNLMGKTYSSCIHIGSVTMCSDLINKGCHPRKSLTALFPDNSQVPEHLIHHFIRGYFDGDGTIYSSQRGKIRSYGVKIFGTERFLTCCSNFLASKGIPHATVRLKGENEKIHQIGWGGNEVVKQLYSVLYDEATIWLKRKRERFQSCKEQVVNTHGSPKTYIFKNVNGEDVIVSNLAKYCRENGHEVNSFHRMIRGERPHYKGFTFVRFLNDSHENCVEDI